MNAPAPTEPTPRRSRSRRRAPRQRRQQLPASRTLAAEAGLKLGINSLLIAAAIAALNQLLPIYRQQQQQLDRLQADLGRTEQRVDRLRQRLGHNLNPQHPGMIVREQTHLLRPAQRRIIWTEPPTGAGKQLSATGERSNSP